MGKPSEKDIASVLHASKAGIVVDLEVSPGSRKAGLSSINPWRKTLCISVKAPPRKGEANKEVMELISELFGVPTNNVSILAGATSSTKRVEIDGITVEQAKKALVAAFGTGDA
jgi:hypothetical protein